MRPGSGVTTCPVCGSHGAKFYVNTKRVMIECEVCHAVVTKPNKMKENKDAGKRN